MSIFQVMQRPGGAIDPLIDSGAVFIEDRFSWFATLLPPLWAVAYGLWLELFIWIAAMVALSGVAYLFGDELSFWLYVLVSLFIGYEAGAIRAKAYARKGFTPAGDIVAGGQDLAEMEWLKQRTVA